MENEVRITVPEGMEIDKENSTFECIKFKKKEVLTYDDVAKELFKDGFIFIDENGTICSSRGFSSDSCKIVANNGTSVKQLEKLLAINKMMNVVKYLNGNWKPDWSNPNENKYCIAIDGLSDNNEIFVHCTNEINMKIAYFKHREFAKQAIQILGEDTIRLALSTDW